MVLLVCTGTAFTVTREVLVRVTSRNCNTWRHIAHESYMAYCCNVGHIMWPVQLPASCRQQLQLAAVAT